MVYGNITKLFRVKTSSFQFPTLYFAVCVCASCGEMACPSPVRIGYWVWSWIFLVEDFCWVSANDSSFYQKWNRRPSRQELITTNKKDRRRAIDCLAVAREKKNVFGSVSMTSSSLEEQLQAYRRKLATYKDGSDSTSSVGGNQSNVNNEDLFVNSQSRPASHSPLRSKANFTATDQHQRASSFAGADNMQSDMDMEAQNDGEVPGESEPQFNYDDDFDKGELSPSETEEEVLTWRTDPARSLSDWTILVSNRETRETTPYHVHRNVLAVGPKKSEYFVRFFLSHDRLHKEGKSTEIWFDSVAADAMPQLLDYMYAPDGTLDISTECAVGLRHLAQFFGMRGLHKKVMAYITLDLTMYNIKTYYQHTVRVDDTKVSELASAHCAEHVMEIGLDDPLLEVIDPSFLRRILLSSAIDSEEKQLYTSQLLAEYCRQHKKVLDDQDFIRLTDENCLSRVHYSAALTLMEMESDLVIIDQHEEDQIAEFTSLQNRCLADLTEHWEELSQMQPIELTRICRKLPSVVVTEIMVRSLGVAKKQLDSGRGGGGSSGMDSSEYEARLEDLKEEHQETLDRVKKEFETNLIKMKEAVVEK